MAVDAGTETLSFRAATEADATEILALWEQAAENDARAADDRGAVMALLRRDPDALDLAVLDGRIVGSLISGWDGWRAHLYRLAVHPDARRRGIGRRLLARAHDRLSALGATRLDAMVLEGNALGQSVWAAEGYRPQEEWRRWVLPVEAGRP